MAYNERIQRVRQGAALRQVPLTEDERQATMLALRDLPETLVGDNPDRLTQLIHDGLDLFALDLLDGDPPLADFGVLDETRLEEDQGAVTPAISKVLGLIPTISKAPLGIEGVATTRQPWLGDIDHVVEAIMRKVRQNNQDISVEDAGKVAEATRLLAGVKISKRSSDASPGPRPVFDGLMTVVRAVVLYRHEEGLPNESAWVSGRESEAKAYSRRSEKEISPKSFTAELCVQVVKIYGIDADLPAIKYALDTFLKKLKIEGRGPCEADVNDSAWRNVWW